MMVLSAQTKGINLIKLKSNDTTFLKENRRIKVKTLDGKSVAGKFIIVNDSEINIKGRIISMDSIVSIRKASTFSTILRTTSISIGTVAVVGGFAMAVSEPPKSMGYASGAANSAGIGVFIIGLPFLITPLTVKKHPVKKWSYEIVN
jgi:uncharacterized membrane-anchored protein